MPGLYAALHALGVIPTERLLRLRRLGGLDGHPDIGVPGIEANSGSLGMGISKGRGHGLGEALPRSRRPRRRDDRRRRAAGGPELGGAAGRPRTSGSGKLLVVVDRNELQSDKPTEEILALGDLEAKLRAFGWHVAACDGHDHAALAAAFALPRRADEGAEGARREHDQGARASRSWSIRSRSREGGGTYRWHAARPTTRRSRARTPS